jgi:hypothetical protein
VGAAALGLPEESLVAAGGASGLTWACGESILRTGDAKTLRREVVAITAASRAVPVPEVLDAVEFTDAEGRGARWFAPGSACRDVPPSTSPACR